MDWSGIQQPYYTEPFIKKLLFHVHKKWVKNILYVMTILNFQKVVIIKSVYGHNDCYNSDKAGEVK